jgi:hypothetical protein
VYSEERITRQFYHCVNIIDCTYTNLDRLAYTLGSVSVSICASLRLLGP